MPRAGSTHVLDAIGHTPLVELRHVVSSRAARVVAKVESAAGRWSSIPPERPGSRWPSSARRSGTRPQEEAIFAGTSTRANVVAAGRVAEPLGPGAVVATIIVDSGLRYLSTDVFSPTGGDA